MTQETHNETWKEKLDETEKCYLEYDDDGYLTCTYDHTAGADCLMNRCQYCKKFDCSCYNESINS